MRYAHAVVRITNQVVGLEATHGMTLPALAGMVSEFQILATMGDDGWQLCYIHEQLAGSQVVVSYYFKRAMFNEKGS